MDYKIIDLNDEQVEEIENRLYEYDKKHITYEIPGSIKVGIIINNELIVLCSIVKRK